MFTDVREANAVLFFVILENVIDDGTKDCVAVEDEDKYSESDPNVTGTSSCILTAFNTLAFCEGKILFKVNLTVLQQADFTMVFVRSVFASDNCIPSNEVDVQYSVYIVAAITFGMIMSAVLLTVFAMIFCIIRSYGEVGG